MKIPDGWPTEEMQLAGAQVIRIDTTPINKIWTANKVFKAMIAAAPTPPAQEGLKVEFTKEWCMKMAQLEGDQAIGAGLPAQDDEPVAFVRRMINTQIIDSTGCKVAWEDLQDGTKLYTRPDNSELRKAAEEVVKISFEKDAIVNLQVFIQAVENLRAALEGK